MLRKHKMILTFIIAVFLISIIGINLKQPRILKADNAISSNYLLNNDIYSFAADNNRFYFVSKDLNEKVSLISCFDANNKTFVASYKTSYLYDACACDGSSLYLARNDSTKNNITIEKYSTDIIGEKEYFQFDSTKIKGKNLLNSNSLAVDADGTIFIVDNLGAICLLPVDGVPIDVKGDSFNFIGSNFSHTAVYATTLSNKIVTFKSDNNYKCIENSCLDAISFSYNFISDNLMVSTYGGVYEINTDTNTISYLFNIQGDYGGELACELDDKILTVSKESNLSLLDLENNKVSELLLNGDIINLCGNNNIAVVLTNFEGTKYIEILQIEDFKINTKPDDDDPSDNIDGVSDIGITSDIHEFNMKDYTIMNVDLGTTIAVFKSNISYQDYILAFRNYLGKEIKSGKLGTGARAIFSKGDKTYEFTFVVAGDLTGEGNSNSRDISLLTNYLLGEESLEGVYLKAADLNNDGEVNALDLLILNKKINS